MPGGAHLGSPICPRGGGPRPRGAPAASATGAVADLAHPFYHSLARGGEGHLEVGKNVYYTVHHLCHMVLALKPFGCMPSSQSDGVQSAVISRFPEMIFFRSKLLAKAKSMPIAGCRWPLGEAKAKAKAEFERCLEVTGTKLDDIREIRCGASGVAQPVVSGSAPRRDVAGVAANFVLARERSDEREAHSFRPGQQRAMHERRTNGNAYLAGLDVGSTTVKAIAVDLRTDQIVWQDYQRHETRQPEKLLEFLVAMEREIDLAPGNCPRFHHRIRRQLARPMIGAKYVQEVNAVALAVEKLHPEVNSVIELGGQDAKIIVFKEDANNGRKRKIASMNDKCAGGTGAVIDKIVAKLKIPYKHSASKAITVSSLHPVAGKCGVFAETDINSLQKQGIPADNCWLPCSTPSFCRI